jgi:hypothetical protein
MHFLYSVYYKLTASTCFEHYLLVIWSHCIHSWYIVCVLCRLAATRHNAHNIPIIVHAAPPDDEQAVLESCRAMFPKLFDVTIPLTSLFISHGTP